MWQRKPNLQEGQDREFFKMANSGLFKEDPNKNIKEQIPVENVFVRLEFTKEEAEVIDLLLSDRRFINVFLPFWQKEVFVKICGEGKSEKEAAKSLSKIRGQAEVKISFERAYAGLAKK